MASARVADTGFEHDREWMIVDATGRFLTQREEPRLALVLTSLTEDALRLDFSDTEPLSVPLDHGGASIEVVCWRDRCAAFDAGHAAAAWLEARLGKPYRLVRFDKRRRRPSNPEWTGGVDAQTQFADGYPWLMISEGSLEDLNARLEKKLPMNRFRPNIVVTGLPPYGEDTAGDFISAGGVRLRGVKPCTRCAIPTTNQDTAERSDEPLRTLRSYRMSQNPRGVIFGQNLILIDGAGRRLSVGETLVTDSGQQSSSPAVQRSSSPRCFSSRGSAA